MKNIHFVPIDNRPITYSLTSDITDVNKNLKLFMPKRSFLGGLVDRADIEGILDWLKNSKDSDLIVLSLDTISYGGLVPSRRSPDTFETIKKRLEILKEILKEKKAKNPSLKVFATSSIMRISNNNVNEEEKEYWNVWGKRIFSYSYYQHKSRKTMEYNCVQNIIPDDILEDYLNTRKRNFEINKIYLEWLKEGILDFMIYSKDDTGEYGLNVEEAEFFEKEIKKLQVNAIVKTGADEIPLGLLLKGVVGDIPLKINVVYSNPDSINEISRYEDISVKKCTEAQIKIGVENAVITDIEPDITLYVNNFKNSQGDLVFQDIINSYGKNFSEIKTPYIIADINNANGADNRLVEEIFKKGSTPEFLSYSGYNTSANTIGSALCFGIISYLAKKEGNFNEKAFKKLLIVRFLDDWAYQANLRIKIQNKISALETLIQDFKPFEDKIKKFIESEFKVKYTLPWGRSFEIETEVEL